MHLTDLTLKESHSFQKLRTIIPGSWCFGAISFLTNAVNLQDFVKIFQALFTFVPPVLCQKHFLTYFTYYCGIVSPLLRDLVGF